jgi:hypothetical protein
MPLLYESVVPLNRRDHRNWRAKSTNRATWLASQNIIPLTVDEFRRAQHHYPIVFSTGPDPVPLALMGLVPGANAFVDGEGVVAEGAYLPAYARRYPFLLAKLTPDAGESSLCFDPASDLVGAFDEGAELFQGDRPTEACQNILQFCEDFDGAGVRTRAFVSELVKRELLVDAETAVRQDASGPAEIFRGFQIIDEGKLHKLRGNLFGQWARSGFLQLVYAHLFSLDMMSELAARRNQSGAIVVREVEERTGRALMDRQPVDAA